MIKKRFKLQILLAAVGLFASMAVASHPYNKPNTFIKHKTDDGRDIYTNIPKHCFSRGLLICSNLHPIIGDHKHDEG